jgi:hypothetical protein
MGNSVRSLFWLSLGVTIGAVTYRKVQQLRANPGEGGLNRAANRLVDSAAHFADEVRRGMAEREAELRKALGLEA